MRRRLLVGALVVVSLALVTVYFRESDSGPLHGVQSGAATVMKPFQVAAERVASPFQDLASWVGGVFDAKSENERLRAEVERLRQEVIALQTASIENEQLRRLLRYLEGPRFPQDYRSVAARVISRAPASFEHQIVVSAGKKSGIAKYDAVVTSDGLVGQVTRVANSVAQVTLLSDEASGVSALDIRSNATGIVRHGPGGTLIMDRVTKDRVVEVNDVIVSAGTRSGELASLYPRGIPICVVTSVGQSDTEPYKSIQCDPFVDFSSLEAVLVLVPKKPRGA